MNKKALVLDDNETICSLINESLSQFDFKIDIANSYKNALKLIDNTYDVIIIDIFLFGEKENGIDFIIQYTKIYPTVKVVILTAHEDIVNKDEFKDVKYDLLEIKPISFGILAQKIYNLVHVDDRCTEKLKIIKDETGRIRVLQTLVDSIKDDLNIIKHDVAGMKVDAIEHHAKIEYLEKELGTIRMSVSTIMISCKDTQQAVLSFISSHSNDNLKIIGSMSGIITLLLSALAFVLKCNV